MGYVARRVVCRGNVFFSALAHLLLRYLQIVVSSRHGKNTTDPKKRAWHTIEKKKQASKYSIENFHFSTESR